MLEIEKVDWNTFVLYNLKFVIYIYIYNTYQKTLNCNVCINNEKNSD